MKPVEAELAEEIQEAILSLPVKLDDGSLVMVVRQGIRQRLDLNLRIRLDEARERIERTLELDPDNGQVRYLLADYHRQQGDPEDGGQSSCSRSLR